MKKKFSFQLGLRSIIVIGICIALNYMGYVLGQSFKLPFWLDMIGTFYSSISLGPFAGIITDVATAVTLSFHDSNIVLFSISGLVVAMLVGYFFPHDNPDYFNILSLAVICGVVSTLINTPLNVIVSEGYPENLWGDALYDLLGASEGGLPLLSAILSEAFIDIPDHVLTMMVISFFLKKTGRLERQTNASAALAIIGIIPLSALMLMGLPMGDNGRVYAASQLIKPSAEYMSVLYDSQNGLKSPEITSVVQDHQGYIWAGSHSGIYRYDGVRFSPMLTDRNVSNVMRLFVDSKGRIWIGTNDSGAFCYNPATQETIAYDNYHGVSSNSIRAICEDSEGNIYLGTSGNITKIRPDKTVTNLRLTEDTSYVISLIMLRDTLIGVNNSGRLFFLKNDQVTQSLKCPLADTYFTDVCLGKNNDIIVATSGNALFRCDSLTSDLIHLGSTRDYSGMSSIAYSPDCNGFFIAFESGMGFWGYMNYFDSIDEHSFNNSLSDVYCDNQGNIWFTSNQQGVCKLSPNPFVNILKYSGDEQPVANSVLRSHSRLYIGTNDGLLILDHNNYASIRSQYTNALKGVRIRHLMEDSKGNIWLSTYGPGGLMRLDAAGNLTGFNESSFGTNGSRFNVSCELSDGTIAAATPTGLTFIKDDVVTGTLGYNDGLIIPQILDLKETEDGRLLAASDGDGIYVIKNRRLIGHLGREQGLDSLVVHKIVSMGKGYVYITGNSLYYHNFSGLRQLHNFPHKVNYDIRVNEATNEAWITSPAGIFAANVDDIIRDGDYTYRLYDITDGLDATLTANSWNYDDEEHLYLSTTTGVRSLSMLQDFTANNDYDLSISRLLCDDNEIFARDGVYTIPASTKRLDIAVGVLDFTLSNHMLRMYLEGTGDAGITGYQNQLETLGYTNLKSGNYTLRLEVLDEFTGEVLKEQHFALTKAPRFNETPLFRAYLVLILVLVVAYVVWLPINYKNQALIRKQYVQIARARQAAEEASLAKSSFLASMSHEIRTPINGILGMDVMILKESSEPNIIEYAKNIKNAGQSLLAIINDILDITKIESGRMKLVPETYEIFSVLNDCYNMVRFRAEEKNLYLDMRIDPNIPSKLYGDEVRVRQIFNNLLSNAVKYTIEGGVTLNLTAKPTDEGCVNLICSVTDTGIGVREEDKDRIFVSFERLDEVKNHAIEGTGLGLNITQTLLSMMKGSINLESTYGLGSTFTVTIPQPIVDSTPMGDFRTMYKKSMANLGAMATRFTAKNAHILVVDDIDMNLKVVSGLLKDTLIGIDTALSGFEAIEKVQRKKYDIIFLDHQMPEMDGMETLRRFNDMENNLNTDTPIIMLTANAMSGAKEEYIREGFTDYLAKPIREESLKAMIKELLPAVTADGKSVDNSFTVTPPPETSSPTHYSDAHHMELLLAVGIDPVVGMSYCMDDREFYSEMLVAFVDVDRADDLESLFADRDYEKYRVAVHALKSTSLTIGATRLSENAKEMENACREGDTDYILANHSKLVEQYYNIYRILKEMIKNKGWP